MRSFRRSISFALAALLLCAAASAQLPVRDEQVFEPLQKEMQRSLARLRQDAFGPPYFVAYRVTDALEYDVSASYGAPLQEGEDDYRVLFAEVRYGDRSLDNTDLAFHGWHVSAAREPSVLRENVWALTDAAYKSAISGFLEKKAKRATEFVPDKLDDFSIETTTVRAEPQAPPAFDKDRARAAVGSLSDVFRRHPEVFEAHASARLRWARRYLLTSEGTRVATPAEAVPSDVRVDAMTRADDGMRLDDQASWSIRSLADLPATAQLQEAAERVARELEALRRAPVQAPTAAPAIFDPEFTGVLFHEALGHKLEGQRQRDPQQSQVFKDLVGRPIIPSFLSLLDDPTMTSFAGQPLHGHYDIDDEGVQAQRVVLVDHGVLRGFLMSRWPVKGFERSNGHGRADPYLRPTGRMANLIVRADAPVPRAELKRRLLALLRKQGKPYGFILVGAFVGENPNSRDTAQTLDERPRLINRVDAQSGKEARSVRGRDAAGCPQPHRGRRRRRAARQRLPLRRRIRLRARRSDRAQRARLRDRAAAPARGPRASADPAQPVERSWPLSSRRPPAPSAAPSAG